MPKEKKTWSLFLSALPLGQLKVQLSSNLVCLKHFIPNLRKSIYNSWTRFEFGHPCLVFRRISNTSEVVTLPFSLTVVLMQFSPPCNPQPAARARSGSLAAQAEWRDRALHSIAICQDEVGRLHYCRLLAVVHPKMCLPHTIRKRHHLLSFKYWNNAHLGSQSPAFYLQVHLASAQLCVQCSGFRPSLYWGMGRGGGALAASWAGSFGALRNGWVRKQELGVVSHLKNLGWIHLFLSSFHSATCFDKTHFWHMQYWFGAFFFPFLFYKEY